MKANLNKYLKKWKAKLELSNWNVRLHIVDKIDEKITKTAYIDFYLTKRVADLCIYSKRLKEIKNQSYWESVIVHELLHLLMRDINTEYTDLIYNYVKDDNVIGLLQRKMSKKAEELIVILSKNLIKGVKIDE
jgi:hypothetical protein